MKANFKVAYRWLLSRLRERTTWVGLCMVGGAIAGHQLDDATISSIANIGMLVAGGLMAHEEK